MENSNSSLNQELKEKIKDPDFVKSCLQEFTNYLANKKKSVVGRSSIEMRPIWDEKDDIIYPSISDYRLENQTLVFAYLKGVEEVTETSLLENVDISLKEIQRLLSLFVKIGFLEPLSSEGYKVNKDKLILE